MTKTHLQCEYIEFVYLYFLRPRSIQYNTIIDEETNQTY